MTHDKRTRSQLTLDHLKANFDESPYKVARARNQLARNEDSQKLPLQTSASSNPDEEDELNISPTKKGPRFMTPAKRPSPLQLCAPEQSEGREFKRQKHGSETFLDEPIPTSQSPKRAESAAPDSPSRRAEVAASAPDQVSRAQSVPAFPQPHLPDGVLGYKDGVPRLNLAHPGLSPSRRSKSPERNILRRLPSKSTELEPIPDENGPDANEQAVIPLLPTTVQPTPQTPTRPTALNENNYFRLSSPLTPESEATELPATELPEPSSPRSIRKAKELEAMRRDQEQFDSAKKAAPKGEEMEQQTPVPSRTLGSKLPAKSSSAKAAPIVSKANVNATKPTIASSSRIAASASLANMNKKPPIPAPTKKALAVPSAVSTLNKTGIKKAVSGKNSPYNPRQDKRSTLGKSALPTHMSVKSMMKKKGAEKPKPTTVSKQRSGPMDAFVVKREQPEEQLKESPTDKEESRGEEVSQENEMSRGEDVPQGKEVPQPVEASQSTGKIQPLGALRATDEAQPKEEAPLERSESRQAEDTAETVTTDGPDYFRMSSLTPPPPTSEAQVTEQPDDLTMPSPHPSNGSLLEAEPLPHANKGGAQPKQKHRFTLTRPSTLQRRVTRSSTATKDDIPDESSKATPKARPRVTSLTKPAPKSTFASSSSSKEAPLSLGPRSPSKGLPSPSKLTRSISNPNIQFSSRFEGMNGEPSALDTLTRALAKLNVPPPSRPGSSLGSHDGDGSLGHTEEFSDKEPLEVTNPRASMAVAGPSRTASSSKNTGRIDSYFKLKPFLPAGSGTGRGLPRNSLAVGAAGLLKNKMPSKPRGFGPPMARGLRASKRPGLPSVAASPVKGGGVDYVDTEMALADDSIMDDDDAKSSTADDEGNTTALGSGAGLMGPPEVPTKKEVVDVLSRSTSSKKRNEGLPTVSSESAEVLSGCVVFVDVRTENGDNAGELFCEMLQAMGARILKTVGQTCTHIVYKDGLVSTLNKYRALHEPLPKVVSLTWVADCVEQGVHVPEDEYLIDLVNINLAGISKRRRSILPKLLNQEYEENKRSHSPASDGGSLDAARDDNKPPSKSKRRKA